MTRSQSVSISSSQRPHSLESEKFNESLKKPEKGSSHTLSWNDVSESSEGSSKNNFQQIICLII